MLRCSVAPANDEKLETLVKAPPKQRKAKERRKNSVARTERTRRKKRGKTRERGERECVVFENRDERGEKKSKKKKKKKKESKQKQKSEKQKRHRQASGHRNYRYYVEMGYSGILSTVLTVKRSVFMFFKEWRTLQGQVS